jgi:hypothetical protein
MDEYNKLKKKRLEEQAKAPTQNTNSIRSSYMNEYNKLRGKSNSEILLDSIIRQPFELEKKDKDEETKSKKEAEPKKEERKWFDTSVFDDGFQWSDIPKAVVGTSTDAVKELINNSKDFKQRTMSWGTKTFIDASTVWLSSLDEIFVTLGDIENDIQIYNAVNSQDYRLEINDESLRVSMYDIISLCNYVN